MPVSVKSYPSHHARSTSDGPKDSSTPANSFTVPHDQDVAEIADLPDYNSVAEVPGQPVDLQRYEQHSDDEDQPSSKRQRLDDGDGSEEVLENNTNNDASTVDESQKYNNMFAEDSCVGDGFNDILSQSTQLDSISLDALMQAGTREEEHSHTTAISNGLDTSASHNNSPSDALVPSTFSPLLHDEHCSYGSGPANQSDVLSVSAELSFEETASVMIDDPAIDWCTLANRTLLDPFDLSYYSSGSSATSTDRQDDVSEIPPLMSDLSIDISDEVPSQSESDQTVPVSSEDELANIIEREHRLRREQRSCQVVPNMDIEE